MCPRVLPSWDSMTLEIRPAAPKDRAFIRGLYERQIGGDLRAAKLLDAPQLGGAVVGLVAYAGGERVGFALATPAFAAMRSAASLGWSNEGLEWLTASVRKLEAIAVEPAAQSHGYGTALLHEVIRGVAPEPGDEMYLYGQCRNERRLISWYRREGFHVDRPGRPLILPAIGGQAFGLSSDHPRDRWFQMTLHTIPTEQMPTRPPLRRLRDFLRR